MVATACLLALLLLYAAGQVLHRGFRALDLDLWEALVYLGLAETVDPAPARRERVDAAPPRRVRVG